MAAKGTPAEILAAAVNKCVGRDIATSARRQSPSDVPGYVSTGALPLDIHMGNYRFPGGGLPLGRIVEIFGHESSGKSTLATQAMVSVQKGRVLRVVWEEDPTTGYTLPRLVEGASPPGVCFLLDTEESFYKDRAQRMGLDLDACVPLLEGEPEPSVEDCFEAIEAAIDAVCATKAFADVPVVIVWDTIAGVDPEADQRSRGRRKAKAGVKVGKVQPGQKARSISQRLREIKGKLAHRAICLIVVNQTYTQIGTKFAGQETPGGKALKFYASLRLKTRRLGSWEEGSRRVGIAQRVTLAKSKVCDPSAEFDLDIRFDEGVDDDYTTAHFVLDEKELWAPPPKKGVKGKSRKPPCPITVKKEGTQMKWAVPRPDGNGVMSALYTRRKWTKFLDEHEGLRESIRHAVFTALAKSREE